MNHREANLHAIVDRLSKQGQAGADAAAWLLSLDDRIKEGGVIAHELQRQAGDLNDRDFTGKFRAALQKRLRRETGPAAKAAAEPATATGQQLERNQSAARRVIEASKLLPASWVRRANARPVRVQHNDKSPEAGYDPTKQLIEIRNDLGEALHEFTHHVQHQMLAIDAHFRVLHRRRTAGEEVVKLMNEERWGYGGIGRRNRYVYEYFGREYGPLHNAPLEVMPTAYEALWFRVNGKDLLVELIENDPEMLHLTIGLLFKKNLLP